MTQSGMNRREVQTTARSLEKSLKSTHKGLEALLASLERSGFRDAISPYQSMQLVLLQQRLWTREHRRFELNALWRKIAATADKIYEILAPFSEMMANLKKIDRVEAAKVEKTLNGKSTVRADSAGTVAPTEKAAPGSEAASDLAELFLQELSLSDHKLRKQLSWQAEARKSRLKSLCASGALERRGWGRSQSYSFTPALQQKISRLISEALTNQDKQP